MNKGNRAVALVVFAFSLSALLAQAQMSGFPQFSADMTSTAPGGQTSSGKVYFGSAKIRWDMKSGGHEMVMIADAAKKTSYMLMPQQKMYMEVSAGSTPNRQGSDMDQMKPLDPNNPCSSERGMTCKKVGVETVNGRSCDKWEFTGNGDKRTVWLDQKLHIPIRYVTAGGLVTNLTNVKEGQQPASLFEIPAGYHKMDMGGMMRQRQ